MKRHFEAMALTILSAALLGAPCRAQEASPPPDSQTEKGTGQRVGERIDEAVRDIRQGVDQITQAMRERFARARESVNAMGIESRIYGRLHWDRELNKAQIDLEVDQDGVATLRGTVPDAGARLKAEQLARDTVGVSRVVNHLTISRPADRSEPAPAHTRPKS